MEVMPHHGVPVSDLVLDEFELFQPFLSSSLGFPVLRYWWSAVFHADVFPVLFHGYFSSGFIVEEMEGPHVGTSALAIFQSKQQMALLLPLDLARKVPYQCCFSFRLLGIGVHEHFLIPVLSTVALCTDVFSAVFFFSCFFFYLTPY